MGKELAAERKEPNVPVWTCELLPLTKEANTVGDLKHLKCSGFDFIPVGEGYQLRLDEEQENVLKILSVKSDRQSVKDFEVTSYAPGRGDISIWIERDGKVLFTSTVKGLNVTSVLKTSEPKPVPPQLGYYILPNAYELLALAAFGLSLLTIFILRFRKKIKKRNEFRRIVSGSRYADPFMDFNIEIRDYVRDKKKSVLFMGLLNDSLKKIFFRIFEECVSLDTLPQLVRSLKGLGLEPHEIRSFYVLEEEYRIFKNLYKEKQGDVVSEKKEFLELSKKTINKLRRHAKDLS